MAIRYIDEVDFENKRVFLRADLNVPLDEDRNITDDTRIVAVLPTIKYILRNGGRLILASHLGRPKGERDEKLSLMPVAERLNELLGKDLIMAPDVVSDGVKIVANQLKEGEALLLENLRFNLGEKRNDPGFAKALASLCDVYVNDAFGACHRAHASVAALPALVPDRAAGMLIRKEIRYLKLAIEDPDHPYLAILGGAKVSDKIGVILSLLKKVDALCIGGGMAYTFLAQMGVKVGNSLVEEGKIKLAGRIIQDAEDRNVKLFLPVDHIIAAKPKADAKTALVTNEQGIPDDMAGLDIGPATVELFKQAISTAATIFWNGPMGVFEQPPFATGTQSLAQAVTDSSAISIVGGGDSVSAIKKAGVAEKVTHISTGGGASLELLEGKVLPGFAALEV